MHQNLKTVNNNNEKAPQPDLAPYLNGHVGEDWLRDVYFMQEVYEETLV